jgi:hypothetical protein
VDEKLAVDEDLETFGREMRPSRLKPVASRT